MSPVWHIKIHGIAPLMERYDDGKADLEETAREVVDVVRKALDWVEGDDPSLDEAFERMLDATTEAEYTVGMQALYDWADSERVWIDPVT